MLLISMYSHLVYEQARNRTTDMKTDHFSTFAIESQGNSKKIWGCLDKLELKKTNQSPSSPVVDGKKITDPSEIANSFKKCFTTIVQKYIPNSNDILPDFLKLKEFVLSKINPTNMFTIPLMTQEQVLKLSPDVDETKPNITDGVSARLLKMAAPVLVGSIAKILNLSIQSNKFPTSWKTIVQI